jgi:hypothetical protein
MNNDTTYICWKTTRWTLLIVGLVIGFVWATGALEPQKSLINNTVMAPDSPSV